MNATAVRRLPGVRVTALPATVPEALPRMDIAVFVGLAASGPVHLPVAVEDPVQFAAIFGSDAPLAWDARRGEPARALLGPAVRAFFANGGRRCWIIRVADETALAEDTFVIPGVVALDSGPAASGNDGQAQLRARAPGSWADSLQVNATVRGAAQPILAADLLRENAHVDCAAASAPQIGDLLRFMWLDGEDRELATLHAFVTDRAAPAEPSSPVGDSAVRLGLAQAFWSAPLQAASPVDAVVPVSLRRDPGEDEVSGEVRFDAGDGVTVALDVPLSQAWRAGDVLLAEQGGERWWFCVQRVRAGDSVGSPPNPATVLDILARRSITRPQDQPGELRCDRLQLDMAVKMGGDERALLSGLGFSPLHGRYVGLLPDDQVYYGALASTLAASRDVPGRAATLALAETAPGKRFPLAARIGEQCLMVPLFATGIEGVDSPACHDGRSSLVRDGLARFGPNLFVDADLAEVTVDRFMEEADAIRYARLSPLRLEAVRAALGPDLSDRAIERLTEAAAAIRRGGSDAPRLADLRSVFGRDRADATIDRFIADAIRHLNLVPYRVRSIHAALGGDESAIIDEATLIAVPDAALPGWIEDNDVELAVRSLALPAPQDDCPRKDDFRDCAACSVTIDSLDAVPRDRTGGDFDLTWTTSGPGAPCVVEVAGRDDFLGARELYRGAAGTCPALAVAEVETYFRIRADLPGESCTWGRAIAVVLRNRRGYRMLDDGPEAAPAPPARTLLAVHRALLRLSAGRGDILAVLSLPERFGAAEAIDHSVRLRTIAPRGLDDEVPPLMVGEERALSYGALYHAWLVTRGAAGVLERTPPDGAACGMMASRTIARGAWIAPANEPLRATVALTRAIPEDRRQALADAAVNLVRREARGFMVLAADTLSIDPELQPINVRRLLILIRRVALRHGVRYVFEPNDDALRRTVERTFEALLGDLFALGAFAGRTPELSFRVDCGPAVNPPANVEHGRFVVELRVAPSLPMSFIAVRLIQTGGGLRVVETSGS